MWCAARLSPQNWLSSPNICWSLPFSHTVIPVVSRIFISSIIFSIVVSNLYVLTSIELVIARRCTFLGIIAILFVKILYCEIKHGDIMNSWMSSERIRRAHAVVKILKLNFDKSEKTRWFFNRLESRSLNILLQAI